MPTYACWTRAGYLSPEQRREIAARITEIHHDVALAPRYFVQVVFQELAPQAHFIGGAEVEPDQVWVRADIRAGRTQDQKARLMMAIVEALGAVAGTRRENVWVYISDIPGTSVVEFGHVLPQPGAEEAWFRALPEDLRDSLRERA